MNGLNGAEWSEWSEWSSIPPLRLDQEASKNIEDLHIAGRHMLLDIISFTVFF